MAAMGVVCGVLVGVRMDAGDGDMEKEEEEEEDGQEERINAAQASEDGSKRRVVDCKGCTQRWTGATATISSMLLRLALCRVQR